MGFAQDSRGFPPLRKPLNEPQRAWRLQPQMLERASGRRPSPGGAFDQAALEQVGLVHVLDRVLLLSHGYRQGGEAHRAAAELLADRPQDLAVQAIEPLSVYLEQVERGRGDG